MSITPLIPPSFLTSLPSGIWSGEGGLPVLPYLPGQDIAVSKAPLWSTQVVRAASGRERRTAYWSYPLWQFELAYPVVRHRTSLPELDALWEFFNSLEGQFAPFLFVDPTDCQVPTSVLLDASYAPILDGSGNPVLDATGDPTGYSLGTGDGATTTFQLTRPFRSWSEPVYGAYAAYVLDNNLTAGSYTISGSEVTFATAPAAGHALTWFGFYYFGCRFLQDDLTLDRIVLDLWLGQSLKFTSLRI